MIEQPDYLAIGAGLSFICTLISASFHTDELEDFRKLFREWSNSNHKGNLVSGALIAIASIGFYALLVSLPVVLILSLVVVAVQGGS